jgi:hypothetical protein
MDKKELETALRVGYRRLKKRGNWAASPKSDGVYCLTTSMTDQLPSEAWPELWSALGFSDSYTSAGMYEAQKWNDDPDTTLEMVLDRIRTAIKKVSV